MVNIKTYIGIVLPIILFIGIGWSLRPLHRGNKTDHFNGRRFYYKESNSFLDMIKWLVTMKTVKWPDWVIDLPQPKPVKDVEMGELKVTYINHASMLIQVDGINILTDPIWSKKAGPFPGIGVKRVRKPGIALENLPQIDVILISYDHYDHLDIPTLKALIEGHNLQIFVGLGVKSVIGNKIASKVKVTELDWWEEYNLKINGVKITFVPASHNSGRSILGGNRTLWGGFVIESPSGNIYFAGDTGYNDDIVVKLKEKFCSFRLTILPIGSYEKRWYMKKHHMNPEDAVKIHKLLASKLSIGMHYATFKEHPEQTIDAHEKDLEKDLEKALEKHQLTSHQFWILAFGEGRYVR